MAAGRTNFAILIPVLPVPNTMKLFHASLALSLAHITCVSGQADVDDIPAAKKPDGQEYEKKCTIAANDDGSDDSAAIIDAFTECQRDGHIVFENTTYNIEKAMSFKSLDHVKIDIKGTLRVRPLTLEIFANNPNIVMVSVERGHRLLAQ